MATQPKILTKDEVVAMVNAAEKALEDAEFKKSVQDAIKEAQASPDCQGDSEDAKARRNAKTVEVVVPLAKAKLGDSWEQLNIPDASKPEVCMNYMMQVAMNGMMDPTLQPKIAKIQGIVMGTAPAV
eukprot:CAMPEP_0169112326 /NCGR_PEP_ID=MMETSP1015-20121227/27578_1 /TAXON_ID=342587 /ORGANISM="Karlodinium micrum, Strain CCMP2283" /LENGTH=126 /DNA_ID=CAMNT_0009174361 /DNA_START=67 /DNA_END=447 /DNA_ORIENTATION=-